MVLLGSRRADEKYDGGPLCDPIWLTAENRLGAFWGAECELRWLKARAKVVDVAMIVFVGMTDLDARVNPEAVKITRRERVDAIASVDVENLRRAKPCCKLVRSHW